MRLTVKGRLVDSKVLKTFEIPASLAFLGVNRRRAGESLAIADQPGQTAGTRDPARWIRATRAMGAFGLAASHPQGWSPQLGRGGAFPNCSAGFGLLLS